jgi:uncharacterized metal-binding protein
MKAENDIFKKAIVDDFKKDKPSNDFTLNVMSKVEHVLEHQKEIKPLIAKKTWVRIITIFLTILLGSLVIETFEPVSLTNNWWSAFKNIDLANYEMTFKLFIGLTILLMVLIVSDMVYRKIKHLS